VNAIKVQTTVDDATAAAIPAFRPLLGKRVELIALQAEAESAKVSEGKLTLDELLARRIDAPTGTAPLTDDDIQRAIITGALETFDTNVVLRVVYRDDPGQADRACSAWQEAVASGGIFLTTVE